MILHYYLFFPIALTATPRILYRGAVIGLAIKSGEKRNRVISQRERPDDRGDPVRDTAE